MGLSTWGLPASCALEHCEGDPSPEDELLGGGELRPQRSSGHPSPKGGEESLGQLSGQGLKSSTCGDSPPLRAQRAATPQGPPGRGREASFYPARACGSQGVELAPSSAGPFLQGREGVRAEDSGVTMLAEAFPGHAARLREGRCLQDEPRPPSPDGRPSRRGQDTHFPGPLRVQVTNEYWGAEGDGSYLQRAGPGHHPSAQRCAPSGPHRGRGSFPPHPVLSDTLPAGKGPTPACQEGLRDTSLGPTGQL